MLHIKTKHFDEFILEVLGVRQCNVKWNVHNLLLRDMYF